jgi:hypothetical protein
VGAPSSFSAGSKRANWDAVFGSNPWLCFLPIDTLRETGYEFDFLLREDEEEPLAAHSNHGGMSSADVELDESINGHDGDGHHALSNGGASRSPGARAMDLEGELGSPSALIAQHQTMQLQQQRVAMEIQLQQAAEEHSMSAIVRELHQ